MATQPLIPVEVYLHTAYEPDAEFVDGEVEVRAMGEYDHSTWQYALQQWFAQRAREWDLRVRVELRVQVKASRFRVPDVVVLDRKEPIEQIVTRPPVAVFEVLSPEDSMTRVMRKLADYAEMGIANIFVVDLRTEIFYRYLAGSLAICQLAVEPLEASPAVLDLRAVADLRD